MFLYSFVFVPQNVFTFECTSVKLENLFFNVNVPQQAWLIHVLGRGQEGGGGVRVWKCKRNCGISYSKDLGTLRFS